MYDESPASPDAIQVTSSLTPPAPAQIKIQTLKAAAEACLKEGWAIIPLNPETKQPFSVADNGKSSRLHNGIHSVYSASFGPERKYSHPKTGKILWTTTALAAWEDGHECNPAVALELSGLTVLDIDSGITSEAELMGFMDDFKIPATRCVRSGRTSSFGAHLYYSGVMESGSFAIEWRGKEVKGEVKSRDKYVAAEGSFHQSGQQYTRLWNIPLTATPVTLFTEILEAHSPSKKIEAIPSTFDGTPVTQEEFETFLEKNQEEVTCEGFNKKKQAFEYIRVDGCPWASLHEQPNGDRDFALYLGQNGMGIRCVHESCKKAWTESSGWKSYRAWLETEKPKADGTKGHGNIPLQNLPKVFVGKSNGELPNASSVSGENMPETPQSSLTLGEGCLDGRLGEICQKHLSAFPLSYSWPALVTAASVLYPPTTQPTETNLLVGPAPMTNLYTGLIGEIGSGKSQCIEQAASILGLRTGHPQLIEAKFGSAEGMFAYLADLKSPFAKLLITPDELSHLMGKTAIEHSSFASNLTSAFYKCQGMLTVKGGKQIPMKHQISIIGGAVTDEFGDMFGAATLGGLYDRFIFGLFPDNHQPYVYKGDGWKSVPPEDVGGSNGPVKVEINPNVYERLEAWKKEHPGSGRCGEIAVRVAMIAASMSGKKVLTADDLAPALVFADYQYKVRHVLKPNPGENPLAKTVNKILNILRAAYPGRIGNREFERKGHKYRVGPRYWDDAIKFLVNDGQIKSEVNATGKKEWRMTEAGYECI